MIEIKNLTKVYHRGQKKALDEVSIDIPNGIFGLIGRNGAGKTTLMRIVATVLDPTDGRIIVDGVDLKECKNDFRKLLGYLPQSTKLMPRLNIVEFLDYICVMRGMKDKKGRREKIASVIETVGLIGEEKKQLGRYSGGMLRRAGIAQAIIGDPKTLIIDEPTTGLDPEERIYFLNLLSRIAQDRTIIFSTHITSDIELLCKNICILELGRVKYLGDKESFVSALDGRIFEHKGTPDDETKLRQSTVVTSVSYVEETAHVRYVADTPFLDGSEPTIPTLEDAYIHALGGVKR